MALIRKDQTSIVGFAQHGLDYRDICIPVGPKAIVKGVPVKNILNETAIAFLARNILLVQPGFSAERFYSLASKNLEQLTLMQRANSIAKALFNTLPGHYYESVQVLIRSMPAPNDDCEVFGLSKLFFLPYGAFIAQYGLHPEYNDGQDPFELSMWANRELTLRSTAEFSIRPFLIYHQARTLTVLRAWVSDPSNHVRRLCSEGCRPRLPWGINLPKLIEEPNPILPILETLKNDTSLYVRRSVANNLGDIAKSHPKLIFDLCESWLTDADQNLRWVIRHGLRYHAKKQQPLALALRAAASR